jgi:hypothetical protein
MPSSFRSTSYRSSYSYHPSTNYSRPSLSTRSSRPSYSGSATYKYKATSGINAATATTATAATAHAATAHASTTEKKAYTVHQVVRPQTRSAYNSGGSHTVVNNYHHGYGLPFYHPCFWGCQPVYYGPAYVGAPAVAPQGGVSAGWAPVYAPPSAWDYAVMGFAAIVFLVVAVSAFRHFTRRRKK